MSNSSLRNRAITLYTVPFRYECGYIFDANGHMAVDVGDVGDSVARVRGWGRIQHMDNPEALQDEIGEMIAMAMTEYWRNNQHGHGR